VRTIEHTAEPAVPSKTGRLATLRALLFGRGSGAPVVLGAVALVCAFAAGLLFSVASAHAEACANEAFRLGPSVNLPECRVYEMVSPVYEGGNGAESISATAPDGESVAFQSKGVFAGEPSDYSVENSYLALRSTTGWSTVPLQLPGVEEPVVDFSPTLESVLLPEALIDGEPAPTSGSVLHGSHETRYLLHRTDLPDTLSNWDATGGVLTSLSGKGLAGEVGASADFCHIVVEPSEGPFLLEATGATYQLYDVATGCGVEPSLSLVAVKNSLGSHEEPALINARCQPVLGESKGFDVEQQADFNDVSADGSEIFFTTNVEKLLSETNCDTGTRQLFVRVGGARTLEVSRPLEASKPFGGCVAGGVEGEVPCGGAAERASAYFKGASEDGSRVFFTTRAPLVNGDKDTQNDLYMATIGCPEGEAGCEPAGRRVTSLVQVSHDPNAGEAAEVQGVVRVASDGGRVYFVARGVLGEGANVEGRAPVKNADNLYVYDTGTGKTAFIADLCSGPVSSGETRDRQCPLELDSQNRNDMQLWGIRGEAQSTPDGEFLVFASFGQLAKGDTDTAKDVYRYDAATGALDRVSLGEGGYDANGNEDDKEETTISGETTTTQIGKRADATIANAGIEPGQLVYQQHESNVRAISEDGSRIVFGTAAPLSPRAVNGLVNIYEWHKEPSWSEGVVSMISSGNAPHAETQPSISPSGRDIFFVTFQGLVPQDTLGDPDVYDARIGGGFAPAPAPVEPCAGDACQGPLTNPAPLLVPGSVSQAPGENLAPIVFATPVSPKKTTSKCPKGRALRRGKCIKTKRRAKGKAGNERRNKS
jgi:hypothetical protein